MSIHKDQHPQWGHKVPITGGQYAGWEILIEDWWDRLGGKSWRDMNGNPACMEYGFRAGKEGLPRDDEVVYGKIGAAGKLIHVSQLGISFTEALKKI